MEEETPDAIEAARPVLADAEFRGAFYSTPDQIDIELNHPAYGWIPMTIDATEYPELWEQVIAGEVAEYVAPDPAIALERERATMVCSRFQAKAALLMAGHLPAVEAAIAQADALTQMAWNDAVEFRRLSATIQTLGTALGMTDEDMDNLFRGAMQIAA